MEKADLMSSYTNMKSNSQVLGTQLQYKTTVRPYISKGANSSLTEKEKAARRLGVLGNMKTANYGGGMGGGGVSATTMSGNGSFFSPQLSTDFLELPQSLREKRELYRHYYNTDPIVHQAIDLHTELPMSKVRLAAPKPRTCPKGFKSPEDYGNYINTFFERMCKKIKLFQRLLDISHSYWLDGNCAVFAEDSTVEVPYEVGHKKTELTTSTLSEDGEPLEEVDSADEEYPDLKDREMAYFQKHYKGLERLDILPLDQVVITSVPGSDNPFLEKIPSEKERSLVEQSKSGDERAEKLVSKIPLDVLEYIEKGQNIPLGIDPDEGSFAHLITGRKGAGEDLGASLIDCILRTLTFREKLRQAQTQIASRNMTPKRLVWAENLSEVDVDDLRTQVDLALVDPDYSVVTNYEVHWEEIGSRDRLLDLSSEYEVTDKQLYAGLGVTESLLNGESTYGGDRVKLEVLNTRYCLYREILQEYVEDYLFAPVARRKGFVETDQWGDEVVLYPRLSFTRLALRDSQDTFDALFNMYQKGSLPVDIILELFNLDPVQIKEKLKEDAFTMNDSVFNEVFRNIYSESGRELVEKTDVVEKIAKYLGLKVKAAPAEEDSEAASRF